MIILFWSFLMTSLFSTVAAPAQNHHSEQVPFVHILNILFYFELFDDVHSNGCKEIVQIVAVSFCFSNINDLEHLFTSSLDPSSILGAFRLHAVGEVKNKNWVNSERHDFICRPLPPKDITLNK